MNSTLVSAVFLTDGQEVILVQEADSGKWNLPAGRVEPGEGLKSGAKREAHEECGVHPDLDALLGVFTKKEGEQTIIQVVFLSELDGVDRAELSPTDEGIAEAISVPHGNIREYNLRSEYISESLNQYQAGARVPLSLTRHLSW